MKKNLLLNVAIAAFLSVFISSCTKEETPVIADPEAIAQEDADMESMMDVIATQIENYTALDVEINYPTTISLKSMTTEVTYPVVTVDFPNSPEKWPRVITIDYGPENIVTTVRRFEDVSVRGKVFIEKTAPYLTVGSVRKVTFDGFYFNDIHIGGEKTYTNKGLNENENLVFEWTVDIMASDPDHFWRKRKVRKERELIAGAETAIWSDNEFLVTGEVRGSNSKKWEYTRTIITPLHRLASFQYPVSGTIEVVNSNRIFTIDYGNGELDNIATITNSNGETKEITLGVKK